MVYLLLLFLFVLIYQDSLENPLEQFGFVVLTKEGVLFCCHIKNKKPNKNFILSKYSHLFVFKEAERQNVLHVYKRICYKVLKMYANLTIGNKDQTQHAGAQLSKVTSL